MQFSCSAAGLVRPVRMASSVWSTRQAAQRPNRITLSTSAVRQASANDTEYRYMTNDLYFHQSKVEMEKLANRTETIGTRNMAAITGSSVKEFGMW